MTDTSPTLRLGRHPERGSDQRATIHAILDSQFVCHVAFAVDGWPYAVPTIYARDGDTLLIHGSVLSRMAGDLREGVRVCVTVTAMDGLVCARSAFNHSVNYRSVMAFGTAAPITGEEAKRAALQRVVEHVLPGRWDEVRQPTRTELRATEVLALALDQVTAKVRSGGPVDTPADRRRPIWSGVLPSLAGLGPPELVPDDVAALALPASVLAAVTPPAAG